MENTSKFVSNVVKLAKENDVTQIAERNEKKAKAALQQQIASLDAKEVDAQVALEDAQEAYEAAIYPTSPIGDGSSYFKNIVEKKKLVDNAQKALEDIKATKDYITELQADKF